MEQAREERIESDERLQDQLREADLSNMNRFMMNLLSEPLVQTRSRSTERNEK